MHRLDIKSVEAISIGIHDTHVAIDAAFANMANLAASIAHAGQASALPASTSQKSLEAIASGLNHIVAGRKGFVDAHIRMIAVKDQSDLKEMGFGCLGDGPLKGQLDSIEEMTELTA